MKPTKKIRKCREKIASKSEIANTEEQTGKKKRRRQTVIKWIGRGETAMGAGNSHDLTNILEENSSKTILDVKDTFESMKDSKCPDPQNTCPVCFSSLKHAYIKGHTSVLLQCTQCPTAPFLCGSCLYPWTTDTATCTNNLCPLVSTLLTCGLVTDSKSNVFGCPVFRACPKCRSLITHESGCKFVMCRSCKHRFCFICLQDDCSNDKGKYWSLTCKKPRAQRQRFILTS